MATTLKNTASGAKSNIFSNAAKRYIGFITAFVGAMILFLGTNITATVIQIVAITLLLIGILLFSGNVKKIFKKQGSKDTSSYFLIGVLLIIVAILLLIFGGQISKWINLIVGVAIALYGLILLISYLIKRKGSKGTYIFNVLVSVLLLATGTLVALLFEFNGYTYVMVTGIFAATTGLISMIIY